MNRPTSRHFPTHPQPLSRRGRGERRARRGRGTSDGGKGMNRLTPRYFPLTPGSSPAGGEGSVERAFGAEFDRAERA